MNNTNHSVAVVVVTFNRLPLLKECIIALKEQTRKPTAIIVVNNASADGTAEWLSVQDGLIILTQQKNIGSAGGFYEGMKYAAENNYDWIWLMDDDAAPQSECLQNLSKRFNATDKNIALAPLVQEGGSFINVHRSNFKIKPDLSGLQTPLPKGKELQEQVIQFASFVGIMVSRQLINACGLPDSRLFFQNDDVEYCLRINKTGKILLVPDAVIDHQFVKKNIEEKTLKMGIIKANDFTLNLLFVKFFVKRNRILAKRNYFKETSGVKLLLLYVNVILNYLKELLKITFLVPFKYKNIYFSLYTKAYTQALTGKPENEYAINRIQKAKQQ
jgi:rhamnopyranosyl-N-acetylglucosaminyl-diphospho-decaprenol beta-1,3/1,4-galactofuranosyltransferase